MIKVSKEEMLEVIKEEVGKERTWIGLMDPTNNVRQVIKGYDFETYDMKDSSDYKFDIIDFLNFTKMGEDDFISTLIINTSFIDSETEREEFIKEIESVGAVVHKLLVVNI